MRVKISGIVQSVLPKIVNGVQAVTKQGKPVHTVFLLQNGPGRAPEISKLKFVGAVPPKSGGPMDFEASIMAWKMDDGKFGFTATCYGADEVK